MVRSYITSLEDRIQELEKSMAPQAPAEKPTAADTIVVAHSHDDEVDDQPIQFWAHELPIFQPHPLSQDSDEAVSMADIDVDQSVEKSVERLDEIQQSRAFPTKLGPQAKMSPSRNLISPQQRSDPNVTTTERTLPPSSPTGLRSDKKPIQQYFGTSTIVAFVRDVGDADHMSLLPDGDELDASAACQVPISTQEYLIDLYWGQYNKEMLLVNKEQFQQDQRNEQSMFYSKFLYLTMLAMGFRYADSTRTDVKAMRIGTRVSALHQLARTQVTSEMVRPRGLPTVQALLILGDLEFHVGETEVAWIYAGECTNETHTMQTCQPSILMLAI